MRNPRKRDPSLRGVSTGEEGRRGLLKASSQGLQQSVKTQSGLDYNRHLAIKMQEDSGLAFGYETMMKSHLGLSHNRGTPSMSDYQRDHRKKGTQEKAHSSV